MGMGKGTGIGTGDGDGNKDGDRDRGLGFRFYRLVLLAARLCHYSLTTCFLARQLPEVQTTKKGKGSLLLVLSLCPCLIVGLVSWLFPWWTSPYQLLNSMLTPCITHAKATSRNDEEKASKRLGV